MKILQIVKDSMGGVSAGVLNKGPDVSRLGVQLDILSLGILPDHFVAQIASWGGKCYSCPYPMGSDDEMIAFLKSFLGYDVYHFQSMLPEFDRLHRLMLAAGIDGVYVIQAHNSSGPYALDLDYSKYDRSEPIVAAAYAFGEWTEAYLTCGLKAGRSWFGQDLSDDDLVVITNSLDLDRYAKEDGHAAFIKQQFRQFYEIPDESSVIGYVGRVSRGKNLELILALATESLARGDNYTYVIAGTGDVQNSLTAYVKEQGLSNVLLLLEWRQDIADFIHLCDVHLLPSLSEGLPNITVETQAAGVPSILSDRIDREVDLGLGLVDFLPIDDREGVIDQWLQQIATVCERRNRPTRQERIAAFIDRGYDNASSAAHYVAALRKLIEKGDKKNA